MMMHEPTAEQGAAIEYMEGNAYVGAGPGTGKTFLLVQRVRALRAIGISADRILLPHLLSSGRPAAARPDRLRPPR